MAPPVAGCDHGRHAAGPGHCRRQRRPGRFEHAAIAGRHRRLGPPVFSRTQPAAGRRPDDQRNHARPRHRPLADDIEPAHRRPGRRVPRRGRSRHLHRLLRLVLSHAGPRRERQRHAFPNGWRGHSARAPRRYAKRREQHPIHPAAAQAPAGTYEQTSVIDRVDRILSYRKVEGHPLVIVTTMARATALEDWRYRLYRNAALALAVFAAVVWLSWLALAGIQREEAARAALHAANQDLDRRVQERTKAARDRTWREGDAPARGPSPRQEQPADDPGAGAYDREPRARQQPDLFRRHHPAHLGDRPGPQPGLRLARARRDRSCRIPVAAD